MTEDRSRTAKVCQSGSQNGNEEARNKVDGREEAASYMQLQSIGNPLMVRKLKRVSAIRKTRSKATGKANAGIDEAGIWSGNTEMLC